MGRGGGVTFIVLVFHCTAMGNSACSGGVRYDQMIEFMSVIEGSKSAGPCAMATMFANLAGVESNAAACLDAVSVIILCF